jgi:hypothetical protein
LPFFNGKEEEEKQFEVGKEGGEEEGRMNM